MERRGRATRIVDWIGVVPVALHLTTIVSGAVRLQWDLRTYLAAARAAGAGVSPYLDANLALYAGRSVSPFVYPPVSLLLFAPLAALPIGMAQVAWITFKTLLLVGLIVLWKRAFVPAVGIFPLALLAVLGWGQSALWDLRTGNVALVEAALVWSALAAYVRGRRTMFAVLIVAAALFKLWPAALLLLLLVPSGERRGDPKVLGLAALALGALVWLPAWIGPAAAWGDFFARIPSAARLGDASPGALGLATVVAEALGASESAATRVAGAVWLGYVAALAAISLPFLRRRWAERDALGWAMAAVYLWVLLAPRPMAYGYAVLTPAPLFFSPRPFTGGLGRLLLAVLLSAQGIAQAARQGSNDPVVMHSPFLLALCVWLLVLADAGRAGRATNAPPTTL